MGRFHLPLPFYLLLSFPLVVCLLLVEARKTPSDFISTACGGTLYPDLCVRCLSPNAASITHRSVRQLAHAALKETLARAESASASFDRLADSHEARDCAQCLGNSVALLRRSVWQMERMGRKGTPGYRFRLDSVVTWTSGALTDLSTCLDGAAANTNVKASVKGQVATVAKMTSVALALLNMIAA